MTKQRFIDVLIEEGYDPRVARELSTSPDVASETEEWVRERAKSDLGRFLHGSILEYIEREEQNGSTQQEGTQA